VKFNSFTLVELALELHPEWIIDGSSETDSIKEISHLNMYQWRRKVCRKADMPSIAMRIDTVAPAQKANVKKIEMQP
jgi:hypothetical protein